MGKAREKPPSLEEGEWTELEAASADEVEKWLTPEGWEDEGPDSKVTGKVMSQKAKAKEDAAEE